MMKSGTMVRHAGTGRIGRVVDDFYNLCLEGEQAVMFEFAPGVVRLPWEFGPGATALFTGYTSAPEYELMQMVDIDVTAA